MIWILALIGALLIVYAFGAAKMGEYDNSGYIDDE